MSRREGWESFGTLLPNRDFHNHRRRMKHLSMNRPVERRSKKQSVSRYQQVRLKQDTVSLETCAAQR